MTLQNICVSSNRCSKVHGSQFLKINHVQTFFGSVLLCWSKCPYSKIVKMPLEVLESDDSYM